MKIITTPLMMIVLTSGLFAQQIEVESFADSQGIQLENGNTTVGFFDDGEWIQFADVDFQNTASITISSATPYGLGSVELRIDSLDGALIGTFFPENTGGWANFQEQAFNVQITNGIHDLFFLAKQEQGVCNLDNFILSATAIVEPVWVLDWSDEFNGNAVDENVWRIVDHGNPDNGELQFYTPRTENVEVSNGTLKLIARKETYTGQGPWMNEPATRAYTSGKIETQGKKSFQYGKLEASMKLPRGKGTWPAFWFLGDNIFDPNVGWPKCGEIDVMEHGQDFDHLGVALHTGAASHLNGLGRTGTYQISDYDTDFHTYGVIWTAEQMEFYVDDNIYFKVTKAETGDSQDQWPFGQGFFMILNHAVGGAWGGTPDDDLYPHTVEVDWVRVYKDVAVSAPLKAPRTNPIAIYPNPTSGTVDVKIQKDWNDSFTLSVYSLGGQQVYQQHLSGNHTRLDLQHLNAGTYLIQITVGNQVTHERLIVK